MATTVVTAPPPPVPNGADNYVRATGLCSFGPSKGQPGGGILVTITALAPPDPAPTPNRSAFPLVGQYLHVVWRFPGNQENFGRHVRRAEKYGTSTSVTGANQSASDPIDVHCDAGYYCIQQDVELLFAGGVPGDKYLVTVVECGHVLRQDEPGRSVEVPAPFEAWLTSYVPDNEGHVNVAIVPPWPPFHTLIRQVGANPIFVDGSPLLPLTPVPLAARAFSASIFSAYQTGLMW